MEKTDNKTAGKILITGGSGLVGRYLTSVLLAEGYQVSHLSRRQDQFGKVRVFRWNPDKEILDPGVFEGVRYVVHLAGAMNKPFFHPPVPAFLLRFILGEMADVVLKGSRVSSERLIKEGYKFASTDLSHVLNDLLRDSQRTKI